MFASRRSRVPVPHAALPLMLALLISLVGFNNFGETAAQSDDCHPAYGKCLPIVEDLNCDDIGWEQVKVKNVDDDPYELDTVNGPGNGITCDGDGDDLASAPGSTSPSTGSPEGIAADSRLVGSSDWTDSEKGYLDAFGPMFRAVGESIGRAGKLINAPQFDDGIWRQNLSAEITIWHLMYDRALEMSPPPAFAEMHPFVLEYFRLASAAGDYLTSWIATPDASYLDQANDSFTQAGAATDQVQAMMEELRRVRGIPVP